MKLFYEKLQHLKKFNIYLQCNPEKPPNIQVNAKRLLLVDTDVNNLILQLKEQFPDDESYELEIRMNTVLIGNEISSEYEFTLFEFDCEIDAEEVEISGRGIDYIVLSLPIDSDNISIHSILSETDSFPQSYELNLKNYKHGIYCKACHVPFLNKTNIISSFDPMFKVVEGEKGLTPNKKVTMITHLTPLPSHYWQELSEIWFCHNRMASAVTADKHDVVPASGRILLSDGFIIMHADDLIPVRPSPSTLRSTVSLSTPATDDSDSTGDSHTPASSRYLHLKHLPPPLSFIYPEPVFRMPHQHVVSPLVAVSPEQHRTDQSVQAAIHKLKKKFVKKTEESRLRVQNQHTLVTHLLSGIQTAGVDVGLDTDKHETVQSQVSQVCGQATRVTQKSDRLVDSSSHFSHSSHFTDDFPHCTDDYSDATNLSSNYSDSTSLSSNGSNVVDLFQRLENTYLLSQSLPLREFLPVFCPCGVLVGEVEVLIQDRTELLNETETILKTETETLLNQPPQANCGDTNCEDVSSSSLHDVGSSKHDVGTYSSHCDHSHPPSLSLPQTTFLPVDNPSRTNPVTNAVQDLSELLTQLTIDDTQLPIDDSPSDGIDSGHPNQPRVNNTIEPVQSKNNCISTSSHKLMTPINSASALCKTTSNDPTHNTSSAVPATLPQLDGIDSGLADLSDQMNSLLSNIGVFMTGAVKLYKHSLTTAPPSLSLDLAEPNSSNTNGDSIDERCLPIITPHTSPPSPSNTPHLVSTQLPPLHNIFYNYTPESLVSSCLLSAGHAHVSYRVNISDYSHSQVLQIMILNWDTYINSNSIFTRQFGCEGDVMEKLQKEAKEKLRGNKEKSKIKTKNIQSVSDSLVDPESHLNPVFNPIPPHSNSTMVPAVKLMYRYVDVSRENAVNPNCNSSIGYLIQCAKQLLQQDALSGLSPSPSLFSHTNCTETPSSSSSSSSASNPSFTSNLLENWACMLGAQRLCWDESMLKDVVKILDVRSSHLPPSLVTQGMGKGFKLSYLVRMNAYDCIDVSKDSLNK